MPTETISTKPIWRLGAAPYLNAKPLLYGLEHDERIGLIYDVPARLPALLDRGAVDAALVPVIDLARRGDTWRIVSDGCVGCDGESLTVRVFSRVAPEAIRTLHVDGDSHTSVALAQIIWQEQFDCRLDILPYRGNRTDPSCDAVLLIGDKVIRHEFTDDPIETDLGTAWKSLTSLPFVFAVWAARSDLDGSALSRRLREARDAGVSVSGRLAEQFGPAMGWPVALAQRYLSDRLKYTLDAPQQRGLARFLDLATKHGLIVPNPERAAV